MHKLIVATVLYLSTLPALAISDLSLVGGWTQSGDARTEEGRLSLENFNVFGVRYEKYYAIFGLENSVLYQAAPIVAAGQGGDGGLSWTGNLVINLPVRGTVPFFGVGIGVLRKFGDSEPQVGTRFQTNWALGVKLRRLVGPIGLRLDYRRITIRRVEDASLGTNELTSGLIVSF